MRSQSESERAQVRPSWISLGSGWVFPASLAALYLTAGYLPQHEPNAGTIAEIMALIATLYVAGFVIALPRLLRAVVLRLAGQPLRVVLLGTTGDELADPRIAPRVRILAVASGGGGAVAALLVALQVASRVPADAYPHAIADVAATVAFLTALVTLLPVPPFTGWSLMLTILDGLGVPREARARRAAQLSQTVALLMGVAWAALTVSAGAWAAAPLALLAVAYVPHATKVAVGRDLLARFLEVHTVADVVRPPVVRARPDESVPMIAFASPGARGAVFVERDDGFLVGAVGTHRLRRAGPRIVPVGAPWRDVMVPVGRLPWGHVSQPATALMDGLRRFGVVLVPVGDLINAVEEDDLFDQAAAWVRRTDQPEEPDGSRRDSPTDSSGT